MKIVFKTVFLALVGLLALAACAPSATAPAGESTGGLYPPQDLSLVANTGKPQFLDSYADW
ncbi:MAG: hypothetical protein K8L97_09070 [Anaerolineae bacterium]|nr:hypothetical protein [Anaerolineae bacterium]